MRPALKQCVSLLKRYVTDIKNDQDLNPVDYRIWGLLQERVYATPIQDVENLKQRLVEEWTRFDQRIVDHAVKQWRERLRACVENAGGHFEHQLR